MKLILFFAYVFFLAIYAVGPIILLLKRQADAAGGKKKLWKTYLALFGVGALSTAAAYGIESALQAVFSPDPETTSGAFFTAFIVAGATEETLKFIALVLFVYW
ncbi:MAG: PrsW family intramembrane metalloprotease, partial [Thermoguttaceae bacterium]|nr:PrsW family intramembrane metalloprotease [Thermoguttaceae bacterium]